MWMSVTKEAHREISKYESYRKTMDQKPRQYKRIRVIIVLLILFVVFLMLPWTQTVDAPGVITTLKPEQRPQELNAIIGGQIEHWYVQEGDLVRQGDTILRLAEVKADYLDPELIDRTREQLEAKQGSAQYYQGKSQQIDVQFKATLQARELKLEQLRNKIAQAVLYVQSDSMAFEAAKTELSIAREQFARQQELYNQGLKSLTELEQRKQVLQNSESKKVIAENKFINARNDLVNARLELHTADREYNEKLAKIATDRLSALSDMTTTQGDVAKLKNQYQNYRIRNNFYYILAPQDGQITKTLKAGIGEVVKDGELLVIITPGEIQRAVEMYVDPIDLPLLKTGHAVRFQFDGWPAIVFSGWPNTSFGTFGGRIAAIDNTISENGKFRILVAEVPAEEKWPQPLRIGGGARGLALLQDVPIWYEIWRQLNGFPPDFYSANTNKQAKPKPR